MNFEDFMIRVQLHGTSIALKELQVPVTKFGITIQNAEIIQDLEFSKDNFERAFEREFNDTSKDVWFDTISAYREYEKNIEKLKTILNVQKSTQIDAAIHNTINSTKGEIYPVKIENRGYTDDITTLEIQETPKIAQNINSDDIFLQALKNEVKTLSDIRKTQTDAEFINLLQTRYRASKQYPFEITIRDIAAYLGLKFPQEAKIILIIKEIAKSI